MGDFTAFRPFALSLSKDSAERSEAFACAQHKASTSLSPNGML
jgi:hypothetical protein